MHDYMFISFLIFIQILTGLNLVEKKKRKQNIHSNLNGIFKIFVIYILQIKRLLLLLSITEIP